MRATDYHLSVFISTTNVVVNDIKGCLRQSGQCEPVLHEQLQFVLIFAPMELIREFFASDHELFVVVLNVMKAFHGHEEISADEAYLILHCAFFVG